MSAFILTISYYFRRRQSDVYQPLIRVREEAGTIHQNMPLHFLSDTDAMGQRMLVSSLRRELSAIFDAGAAFDTSRGRAYYASMTTRSTFTGFASRAGTSRFLAPPHGRPRCALLTLVIAYFFARI